MSCLNSHNVEVPVSRQQAYQTQAISINRITLAETGYSLKNKCLSKVNIYIYIYIYIYI